MPSLLVRNVGDEIVRRLKLRAARKGHSAEAEHRDILARALTDENELSFEAVAQELRALTRDREQTPSERLQREGRSER